MARSNIVSLGSVKVTDEARRLFNVFRGQRGLATNEDIRGYCRDNGCLAFDEACNEGRLEEARPKCPWPNGACNHPGPGKLDNHRGPEEVFTCFKDCATKHLLKNASTTKCGCSFEQESLHSDHDLPTQKDCTICFPESKSK